MEPTIHGKAEPARAHTRFRAWVVVPGRSLRLKEVLDEWEDAAHPPPSPYSTSGQLVEPGHR